MMDKNKRLSGKRESNSEKGDRKKSSEPRGYRAELGGSEKKTAGEKRTSGERRPRIIREDQVKKTERPFRRESSDQGRRPAGGREKRFDADERNSRPERKPYGTDRPDKRTRSFDKPERRFGEDERKPRPERKPYSSDRPEKRERSFDKPERRFGEDERKPRSEPRPYRTERPEKRERSFDKPERRFADDENKRTPERSPFKREKARYEEPRPYKQRKTENRGKPARKERPDDDGTIRLNKYIANAGICSRREADDLIQAGAISVNGVPVTELGTKVSPLDKIKYGDQTLSREKPRYVLLNKPKGFITTTDDPENRKTVMNLVSKACKERIYPIGRLDRNTTGLLLFTNDGDMAKNLAHPRYGIKKIYHVVLDRNLTKTDMKKISDGIMLDDGQIKVDAIEYITEAKDKKEVGIELHSGKNRVVRRIFETLEYKVVRLDRVVYAGLTKKNLPRGEWRFLEQKEINMLKIIS